MFKFLNKQQKTIENIEDVVKELELHKKELIKMANEIDALKKKTRLSIQKVGIVRFNPFPEIGGDQSFSLALLDEDKNGIVITSLYSRDNNRIYGKPIIDGQSSYQLSEEEKEAIESAGNLNNK
ncbi:MAG: DUF4446 family protein [bacterium]